MKKTFHIETFGCQMNKGDSDLMTASLLRHGFVLSSKEDAADVIIFNTCSVRSHAEERALARIRSARKRQGGRRPVIAVAGCMAQRIGDRILTSGDADLVIGPYQAPDIGRVLNDFLDRRGPGRYLSLDPADLESRIDPTLADTRDAVPWHKWITITHGCGNFCSYCIVPHVRGPLVSFPSKDILEYIRACADGGIREITLLGQNVNQYGMDSGDIPFYTLLERVAKIDGLLKINFLTSHPKDFSGDILNVIRDHGNISRAIHLPLQSGSDTILRAMNRRYTLGHYMNIAELIGKTLESYSLSTDLIVGFPGETAEDYEMTLRAVHEVRFDEAFMYAYSPRECTAAYELEESLSREEKQERLKILIDTQRAISREKLEKRLNRVERMIVEGQSKRSPREVMGKTWLNHPVVIPGDTGDVGKDLTITVTGIKGSTLYGQRFA